MIFEICRKILKCSPVLRRLCTPGLIFCAFWIIFQFHIVGNISFLITHDQSICLSFFYQYERYRYQVACDCNGSPSTDMFPGSSQSSIPDQLTRCLRQGTSVSCCFPVDQSTQCFMSRVRFPLLDLEKYFSKYFFCLHRQEERSLLLLQSDCLVNENDKQTQILIGHGCVFLMHITIIFLLFFSLSCSVYFPFNLLCIVLMPCSSQPNSARLLSLLTHLLIQIPSCYWFLNYALSTFCLQTQKSCVIIH